VIGVPAIRDRAAERAAVLVLEPIFESDLQPEQYAYRRDRSALDAVVFAPLAILFDVFIIGCADFKPSWLAATREIIHRKRKILARYRKCAGAVQPRKPRVCSAGALAIRMGLFHTASRRLVAAQD